MKEEEKEEEEAGGGRGGEESERASHQPEEEEEEEEAGGGRGGEKSERASHQPLTTTILTTFSISFLFYLVACRVPCIYYYFSSNITIGVCSVISSTPSLLKLLSTSVLSDANSNDADVMVFRDRIYLLR